MALASHSIGDGSVLVVLVLTIYERAQKVACPRRAKQSGCVCLLQTLLRGIILLCSFVFVKWEWNSPSEVCLAGKNDTSAVHSFLSQCLERSASFLVASGQRQTYWRCSQLPEVSRMLWFKLLLYSGLGSPTCLVIFIHRISFGCISLRSLYPSLYLVYNSENCSEQEGF